jgi:hypothetical protein
MKNYFLDPKRAQRMSGLTSSFFMKGFKKFLKQTGKGSGKTWTLPVLAIICQLI